MIPVTSQPYAINTPVVAAWESGNEKGCSHQHQQLEHAHESMGKRCQCNRPTRSRRIATAVLLTFFSLLLLLLVSCLWDAAYNNGSWLSSLGFTEDGTGSAWAAMGAFAKRQSGGSASSGNGNAFVDRKCAYISDALRLETHSRPSQTI